MEKKLEKEIKKEAKHSKLQLLMIALVAILFLFSVAQTFEVSAVKDKVINIAAGAPIGTSQTANALTKAPARAPSMVGGC